MSLDIQHVSKVVRVALEEDIGPGDITTLYTAPENQWAEGDIVAKEEGILAGLEVAREVYRQIDGNIKFVPQREDGFRAKPGDVFAVVSGPVRGLLTAERTALNFLQRLSGIATVTNQYVKEVEGTGVEILDTRKTTPGLRVLEKYAVRVGGGRNHRQGLYDMILIKDNHLRLAGSIRKAVEACKEQGENSPVEIEVKNRAEVEEAIQAGADRIMLDNMPLDTMTEAVTLVRRHKRKIEIEASGGIGLDTVRDVAATGIDFISIGALTHSPKALDIAFNLH